jgi:tetratricopeptide (TPR) repeat protein
VGTVLNETEEPIQGATVTAENTARSFTSTTDEKGFFGFIALNGGPWAFTVQSPGFTPSQQLVRVREYVRNRPLKFMLARGAAGFGIGALTGLEIGDVQEKLQAAESAEVEHRYEDAIHLYQEIIEIAPALTMVNLKLGHAYFQNESYEEAQIAYQMILGNDLPSSIAREVYCNFGDIRLAVGMTDEAQGWYWKAHNTDVAWSKPLLKLGRVALATENRESARMFLEMAITSEPNSTESAEAKLLLEQVIQSP